MYEYVQGGKEARKKSEEAGYWLLGAGGFMLLMPAKDSVIALCYGWTHTSCSCSVRIWVLGIGDLRLVETMKSESTTVSPVVIRHEVASIQ